MCCSRSICTGTAAEPHRKTKKKRRGEERNKCHKIKSQLALKALYSCLGEDLGNKARRPQRKKMCACKVPSFVFVVCRCINIFPMHSFCRLCIWGTWTSKLAAEESSPHIPIDRIEASHGAWHFRQQIELKNTNSPFGSCHSFAPVKTFCGVPRARTSYHPLSLTLIEISSCGQMDGKERSDHTEFKHYNFLLLTSNLSRTSYIWCLIKMTFWHR